LWQLKALGLQEVVLVSVIESLDEQVPGLDDYRERQQVLLTAYLHDIARRLEVQVNVVTELRCGRPDAEIRKVASTTNADLVFLTTHGRSGITRWSIGSVADKVIRQADRPTLVLGPEAAKQEVVRDIKRILVPLDGSVAAEHALTVANEWAGKLDATLHLVRVVSLVPLMAADPVTGYYPAELLTAVEDAATDYLKETAKKPGLAKLHATVMKGDPAQELTSYATENEIDLVVMASHGRGGAVRAVLGSTADRMLHGPAPVLVLPVRQ
jgi:nucleotide-binding universal stress UspA family protein